MEISNLSLKSLRNYKTLTDDQGSERSAEQKQVGMNREELRAVNIKSLPPNTSIRAYMKTVMPPKSPAPESQAAPIHTTALQEARSQYYNSNHQKQDGPIVQTGVLASSDLSSHDGEEFVDKPKYHRNESKAKYISNIKDKFVSIQKLIDP